MKPSWHEGCQFAVLVEPEPVARRVVAVRDGHKSSGDDIERNDRPAFGVRSHRVQTDKVAVEHHAAPARDAGEIDEAVERVHPLHPHRIVHAPFQCRKAFPAPGLGIDADANRVRIVAFDGGVAIGVVHGHRKEHIVFVALLAHPPQGGFIHPVRTVGAHALGTKTILAVLVEREEIDTQEDGAHLGIVVDIAPHPRFGTLPVQLHPVVLVPVAVFVQVDDVGDGDVRTLDLDAGLGHLAGNPERIAVDTQLQPLRTAVIGQ